MARTALPVTTPLGPYPDLPLSANALDFTFTAADTTNGNQFPITGREILLVRNTNATTAQTFTIVSAKDERKRTGDIQNYSLGPGEFAAFSFFGRDALQGWRQTDKMVYLDTASADIQFAVLRLA